MRPILSIDIFEVKRTDRGSNYIHMALTGSDHKQGTPFWWTSDDTLEIQDKIHKFSIGMKKPLIRFLFDEKQFWETIY